MCSRVVCGARMFVFAAYNDQHLVVSVCSVVVTAATPP